MSYNIDCTTTATTTKPFSVFLCRFQENLSGRHAAAWRTRYGSRQEAARAPDPLVAEARAADRAHGPCRDLPPLQSTVSAEAQGGLGERHVQHDALR